MLKKSNITIPRKKFANSCDSEYFSPTKKGNFYYENKSITPTILVLSGMSTNGLENFNFFFLILEKSVIFIIS